MLELLCEDLSTKQSFYPWPIQSEEFKVDSLYMSKHFQQLVHCKHQQVWMAACLLQNRPNCFVSQSYITVDRFQTYLYSLFRVFKSEHVQIYRTKKPPKWFCNLGYIGKK